MTAHYVIAAELHALTDQSESEKDKQWRELYNANIVWSIIEDVTQVSNHQIFD